MKLYSRPLSPYAAFVRAVAYIKQLPVKIIAPPEGYPIPDSFYEITPLKRIPVLITGSGETLFEAAVIAEYFEERFPETQLLPEDPRERAQIRILMRMAELEVLPGAMSLFMQGGLSETNQSEFERFVVRLKRGLNIIEDRLSSGPYANGETISLADAWLLPVRFIFEPLRKLPGLADILDETPKFEFYAQNACQHPALAVIWAEMQDGLRDFKPELA